MADSGSFSLNSRALKLTSPADIDPHIAPLQKEDAAKTLRSVDFSGNTLGPDAAKHIAPLLESLTTLETANLADLFTGRLLSEIPPALSSLLTALAKLPKLAHINLNDNAFGLNTIEPLVEYIPVAIPLQHLLLNNNGLGPEAGKKVANAISELATKQSGKGLKTIICGRNRLEQGSMEAWAKAVKAHGTTLEEIRMVQNGIRMTGVEHFLREGLAHCTSLRVMDLQDNTFTKTGAKALSEVVGNWPELRELGVGDSLLSSRGMTLLANALGHGKNKKLEILRLQYNEIDAKAVQALVDAIVAKEALPLLRRVELNGNRFSEDDAPVEELRTLLEQRKKQLAAVDATSDDWGLDDLSDLDSEQDDDEDDDEDDEDEPESHAADEAEAANVAQEKDSSVDALADRLGKTGI